MAQQNGGGVEDRLSVLPDHVLGHILSYLSPEEAGCAAVLSTRWRYMFAHVHTLSFQAEKRYNFWSDTMTFYVDSEERRSTNGNFLDRVNAALLARRRCAGCLAGDTPATPLRVFRVAFHTYQHWDDDMVSMWVYLALQQSEQELHLDLRLHTYRPCEIGDGRSKKRISAVEEDDCCSEDGFSSEEEDYDSESGDMYFGEEDQRGGVWKGWSFSFPRPLFTSAVLRSLRLSHCRCLDPPAAIVLPSLETLHLTAVIDSEKTIQRLVSSCPRLADLTLESCSKLTRLSVRDKRLRRLALLCCHSVVNVSLDASELRFLRYRGAVPAGSLFSLHGSPRIHYGTIDFCGPNQSSEEELAAFRLLLENFKTAKHLHLNFGRLGCSDGSKFLMGFPAFHSLQKLKLTGCLESHSITRVLQQTPNLEVLSLFLVSDHEHSPVTIPDAPPPVLCLEHRLKEIKLVHYQGSEEQRTLAQLLLGSALVLQTLCVVFPNKTLEPETTLMAEIKRWVVSKSPKMSFL